MFKFLKDKLKKSVSAFSRKIDETGDEELIDEDKLKEEEKKEDISKKKKEEKPKEEKKEGFFKRIFKRKDKEEDSKEKSEEKKEGDAPKEEDKKEDISEEKPEKEKVEETKTEEEKEEEPSEEKETEEEKIEEPVEKEKEEVEEEKKEEEPKNPAEEEKPKEEKKKEKAPEEKVKKEETEEEKADETKKEVEKEEEIPKEEETAPEEETEEVEETQKEKPPEEKPEKPAEETKVEEKEEPKEKAEEEPTEDKVEKKPKDEKKEEEPKKKSFLHKLKEKVVTKKINNAKFEEIFWDMEVVLLENNMAIGVIEKIKEDLKEDLVNKPIRRNKIEETILSSLKNSIEEVLSSDPIDLLKKIKEKKPYVICFVGVNGSGKTTTIAKMAKLLLDNNKKVVLAASDTFRAAAIDQLQIHADNLGIKMIKHDYGSDPAAVAFDAIRYAQAKELDVVLIDTAGRLHSNANLVDEMKKIIRISNPDLKLFVGEAITGNDCVEQAEKFNEAIEIDGIILSKADIDEKGGASISVSYVTKKPILYIGTGQEYNDLKPFDKQEIIKSLGLV